MTLTDLATRDNLSARKIDVTDTTLITELLAAASDAVRGAAGGPISRATSTIRMSTEPSRRIELPARPVHSVTDITLDGEPVLDAVLRGSNLWRPTPWQEHGAIPSEIVLTMDHGRDAVPGDVVDLVCSLVAAGLAAAEDGYDPKRQLAYERIDDYQAGFRQGDNEVLTPMELPEATRRWLRSRFGMQGVVVLGTVR